MCTGIELAAGAALFSAATSAGMGFLSASNQAEAENRQYELYDQEQLRLQEENNRIAQEAVTDRVRETNQQLGSIRAAAGELGGGLDAFVIEAGALEGLDLGRIEANRLNQEESLQAAKRSGRSTTLANIQQGYDAAVGNAVNQGFKATGAGIQLADDLGYFDKEPTP